MRLADPLQRSATGEGQPLVDEAEGLGRPGRRLQAAFLLGSRGKQPT